MLDKNDSDGKSQKAWMLFVIVVLASLLVGCGSGTDGAQIKQGYLKLAGSTTLELAARPAAEAYMLRFPNIEITIRGGGSTIGITGVASGALDIGMASRPFKEDELAEHPTLTATVIGRDGVAVVINKALYDAGVTQLTLKQLAGIWRGEITNWQEVGGPDLPIVAYDKELGRGTRDTFAKIVLGDEGAPAPGTVGVLGENEDILSAVSAEQGTVSILSSGWVTEDVVGLAIVGTDGQAVKPTEENVASGLYPITRDLNLITDGPPQGLAAQFIDFMLSPEGQKFIIEANFVPVSQ